MEITKENFFENLPKIKKAIRSADFIAIDCELTGLDDGITINQYDTPKQVYEKTLSTSMNFTVIQYGICTFRYDEDLKGFKQQGYNFYIFPTIFNKCTPDHRFLCQTSSINFLVSHGFDFNKMFRDGIPYLSHEEESTYRDLLKTRVNQRHRPFSFSPKRVSPADKETIDSIFEKIEQFIISGDEEMQLPQCNGFIRKMIYSEALIKLENRASLETRRIGDNLVFIVTKWKSKETKETEEKKKNEATKEEFHQCIGFSEVIKCIVDSGKLIVGHNMLLDFLHTIDKFLQKLPTDYDEFKFMAHCLFANVLDTKYMSSSNPYARYISSTALPNLLESVKSRIPIIEIEENCEGYDLNCPREHEAGYDAYMTGISFLAMWNNLGTRCTTEHLKDFSLLEPYKNRLYLMRLFDNSYIHLGGADPSPSRDHILYLTFPKEWEADRFEKLFASFGGVDNVAWLDNTSAYVSLRKHDQVSKVLKMLSRNNEFQVSTFANRQAQLEAQRKSKLQSIPNKRKISTNEPNVKKRKTDTIEDKTEVVSKTYASVTAKTKSPIPIARNTSPNPIARNTSPNPIARNTLPNPIARNASPNPVARNTLPQNDPSEREITSDANRLKSSLFQNGGGWE